MVIIKVIKYFIFSKNTKLWIFKIKKKKNQNCKMNKNHSVNKM